MKKIIANLMIIMTLIGLTGCSSEDDDINNVGDVINITEEMYVTWINEIYVNEEDYIGKKVKIEGIYSTYYSDEEDATYNLVYRTGPGCCGNDGGMCGFEFESGDEMPQENDWIAVEGTLGYYEVNGYNYLTIKNAKIDVKEERGAEVVSQ